MSPAPPEKDRGLYLLVGKEDFLKKEFVRELRASLFPKGGADLNGTEFRAGEKPLSFLFEFLQTAPFLSEKRLAVVSGVDDFEDEEWEAMVRFSAHFPSTAALALLSDQPSAKKSPFPPALIESGKVVACYPPFDRDLPGWIEGRARRSGVTVDRDAVPVLVERSGRETAALASALETLAIFVHPAKRVTRADAERLLGKSVQADVFELVDRVLDRDAAGAATMTASLLEEGTRGFEVVAVLAGQFERLRRARRLLDRGLTARDVGVEMKVHSFFLDKFVRQASKAPAERLRTATARLLACDEAVKTGKAGDRIALERLVLELCL